LATGTVGFLPSTIDCGPTFTNFRENELASQPKHPRCHEINAETASQPANQVKDRPTQTDTRYANNTMTMTSDIWKILVKAIESTQSCPAWLNDQAGLNWETVSRWPVVDASSNGQHALPTAEGKIVGPDYLDFLREQIEVNARGPEWLALLKNRLAALEPFVGKKMLVATFHSKLHSATLRIRPDTKEVIHLEAI
jgi:hypothetical protein